MKPESFWSFVRHQFTRAQPVVTTDLTGKTVVVLGANTGIGFEAAKHFATMNPGRLILACRSQSKGQTALEKLKAATGCTTAELWLIDLADFASVKRFAERFELDGGRLDLLVENAAVGPFKYEPTKDGWELSLQVNCLSTSLLALLLLPRMVQTATEHGTLPRIVVVSSGAHYYVTLDKALREDPEMLKTVGSEEYCTPQKMMRRYVLTKFLNVIFVRALNERLASETPLIINAANPGYCYSELRRYFTGFIAVMDAVMQLFLAFTPERGSRQLVWAALALEDQPEQLRGAYISRTKIQEHSDFELSAEGGKAQDSIWDEMVEILGKVDPRVMATVDKYLSPAV
ncbi:hypothetical protein FB451DRAFT_1393347 [Mycena latifolia]|nr:hypothetical protein FB451DRAFT_1393347 [Mycena latifolia]